MVEWGPVSAGGLVPVGRDRVKAAAPAEPRAGGGPGAAELRDRAGAVPRPERRGRAGGRFLPEPLHPPPHPADPRPEPSPRAPSHPHRESPGSKKEG
jgi:hypothetical protein